MNQLDDKINQVSDRANAGIAAAMAMASMPIKAGYRYSLTMGMAGYVNQQAIAMGVKLNATDKAIITMNASYDSQNNVGLGLGLGFAVGIN
ncbi:YadA C-terminal domain-containing protein [Photobacterium leiognathi subsp. mandapamensis]